MTDWDEVIEYIHHAMEAVEEAHAAAHKLREEANHTTLDAFREKMAQLQERQKKLMMVLDNEEAYAIDELVDAISRSFTGHSADYRRTPRMAEEKEPAVKKP